MDRSGKVPQFEVSVRDLVREDEAIRRIGFERGQAWRRFALGTQAHRRVLAARQEDFPGYLGEVALSAEFETASFCARLTGRADGAVETQPGEWLIEEYKTCAFRDDGSPLFSAEREERARRQLLAYGVLWEASGRGRARTALVLVDGAGEREERRAVRFEAGEARASIVGWLTRWFRALLAEEESRRLRACLAPRLPFPHAAPRPVQERLMAQVREAVDSGGHLMAQAPTGSGKTAAALHASLAGALSSGRKLLFLTAKNLQQNLAMETLARMNEGGFRVVRMRAKERMCANDRIICHEEHCAYAADYPAKMARSGIAERLLARHAMLDPDTVFAAARAAVVCPFEVQLELAGRADVFVGDYNYVFEPVAALAAFSPEELRDAVLVVDEAHNLPERVRRIYSPEISEAAVAAAENVVALSAGPAAGRIAEALPRLRALLREAAAELADGESAELPVPASEIAEFLLSWDAAMISYFEWKRETADLREEDPIVALHFAVVRFARVAQIAEGHEDFVAVASRGDGGARLAIVCLDPARCLGPILNAASSAILMSATLEPFEMFRRLCGLDESRTATLALPPPFPEENRRILAVPTVRTNYSARERDAGKIARLLAEMSDAHAGNSLAIFPSYRFLRSVAAHLPPTRSRVVAQKETLTDFEKSEILAALSSPPEGGILFLAVAGGMFSEGVDYPGEKLSSVFIVSPALPQVSFERELLRRYFDERDGSGFEFAYLLPGMIRVIQSAGRLIRSETDRGVIALLCRRFLEEPYVRYLPRDWYREDPRELSCREPARMIREFFAA